MAAQCAVSDLVITTAQLFGRKAPVVISDEMLKAMRPGTVVIDYAVESGGNVGHSQVKNSSCMALKWLACAMQAKWRQAPAPCWAIILPI